MVSWARRYIPSAACLRTVVVVVVVVVLFATEISWEGPPKKVEPGMEVAQPFEGPGGVGCHPYW